MLKDPGNLSYPSLFLRKKKKKSFLKGSKQVVLEGECGYSTRLPTMGVSCV